MNKAKIKKAHDFHASGELDAALAIYQELLGENPNDPDLLHIIGVINAQLSNLDLAKDWIQRAILTRKEPHFYNSLGNVLRQQQLIDAALTAYQTAIELKSDYAIAYNNLGLCHYEQKNFAAAKTAYEKALALSPSFAHARVNYAILQTQLGEFSEAKKNLEKAIELNPNDPKAYGQLANIYLTEEDYDQALRCFDNKLRLLPEDADTYYDIGVCLLKMQNFDDAIQSFEKALLLQSQKSDLNHNLATAYLLSGDSEKAINYYFRQLEVMPMVESYYNIGVLLMNQNRTKESIQYLEHAASLQPEYFPIYLNLGALYLKLQNMQKAIECYKTAAKFKPDDVEIAHIVAALTNENTPEAAPKEYLQHLFDQYAFYYDKHLTEALKYQVPEVMWQAFFEETNIDQPKLTILDLGCGTGLSGEKFRRIATRLIGIDVSEQMLVIAKTKEIYDELLEIDVDAALMKFQNIDLILAADVFTYIGNLAEIFIKAKQALKPHGYFMFSVEKTTTEPYELKQTIRYSHSKKYLEQLISENNFTVIRFDNIVMRQQNRQAVEGYLVLLQS